MPPEIREKDSVLLVDDNRFVLEMYADEFRTEGFNADIAVGAAEALRKIRDNRYQAIIIDLLMVAVDGVALLEKMKEGKLGEGALLILLTNSDDPDKISKAKELGVTLVLRKLSTVPREAVAQVSHALQAKNSPII